MTSQAKTFLALAAISLMALTSTVQAEETPAAVPAVEAAPSDLAPSDAGAAAAEPSEASPSEAAPSDLAPSVAAPPAPAPEPSPAEEAPPSIADEIDAAFGVIVGAMASVLFFSVGTFSKILPDGTTTGIALPLIVVWLLFGALFFTFFHRFLNIRAFKHAIDVTRGKYDNPDDPGEISHFQALTSALSATVGLGNIAGVAVAIGMGGPGAVFWMILIGLCGMSAKFHECTLAQIYREVDKDGVVHGGPMYYLSIGLQERGIPPAVAKAFGVIFALFCIGGSFGGGNMFQANQARVAAEGVLSTFFGLEIPGFGWIFGIVLAAMVGVVIIGGIKRIGNVTEKIIPLMCGIYVLAGLVILLLSLDKIPGAINVIITEAFTFQAGVGGFVGVAVQGIKRAVFSNEAGIGSAAIAHSAAKTDEPVREGIVALLEPFIDTVVICTMTALVVVVSGAYDNPAAGSGVAMTNWAFEQTISWFPLVLGISVFLFAYSTMISWSYYGEKCWAFLFGREPGTILVYRAIFLVFVVLGSIASLGNVIDFSDLMILSMAFPNILGGIILAPVVRKRLDTYWGKLQRGEFKVYK